MKRIGSPLIIFLMAVTAFAGCLGGEPAGSDEPPVDQDEPAAPLVPVEERKELPFDVTGGWSVTLEAGLYEILPVQSINVTNIELPPDEGGAAADPGGGRMHLGLWLPDVPEGTKVPVIADVGPYYEDGDVAAIEPANRLGRFLIENFVPHGYGVAQVSVFGTGQSNHCMDLMGNGEQLGIDAAVTWLGTQEWSNGNVGLIGRSYDGSTPWEAATFGNPHLATIVPISGLIGVYDLMWRNGSAETRGPIMHNVVYGSFGVDGDAEDSQNACTDYATGPAQGGGAYASGSKFESANNPYWVERYFLDRALANYKGSVYQIHGMQDWNVDPHMAFPTHQRLEEAGIEVKGLYGQWQHMYPDRPSEHDNSPSGFGAEAYPQSVRYDWAQDLLEWFDHYLMETGPKPALQAEVQDHMGNWRIEDSYPPTDGAWNLVGMDEMTQTFGDDTVVPPTASGENSNERIEFQIEPLDAKNDTRIAGNVRFHVTATPTGPGGQLYAHLEDAETGMRFGHAIMDLRFHRGGDVARDVEPGVPIVVKMEFEAMDVILPAGHGMNLTIAATGRDYLPAAVSEDVTVHADASSVLKLLVVTPDPEDFFTPPQWWLNQPEDEGSL